jgi:hypothetical protein
MLRPIRIHGWALLGVIALVPAVHTQQTDAPKNDSREQPVAPVPAPLPAGSTSVLALNPGQAPTDEAQVTASHLPLSGVEEPTLGPRFGARNFLLPSVIAMSQMATNYSGSGYGGLAGFSYVLGTLDLNHVSDRSELFLRYSGGGMFSSYMNSAIQDVEFSYTRRWQRWSLLAGDQASYLSESSFGFGGVGGLAFLNGVSQFSPGGALGSFLNAYLTPNQTIPTILVPRLSNTAVAQIEYTLSPRSSWTASGSYGMLNFLGVGFINSAETLFQTGYNYRLSPLSAVAVIYRHDDFRFTHLPQAIEDNLVQLGYTRNVTGRMNFHLVAGPSMEKLRGVLTGSANRLSWALDSALSYRLEHTTLLIGYDRFVTGGSGVLVGAQMGQVEAAVERKLSPRWQVSASLGYATNKSVFPSSINLGKQQYNSWYAALRFNHQLRPGMGLFMSYGARRQANNATTCVTASCGTASISHQLSVGFNFDLRPISLR